jgi:hypothetical protein
MGAKEKKEGNLALLLERQLAIRNELQKIRGEKKGIFQI